MKVVKIDELIYLSNQYTDFSCKPSCKKYKEGTIFDEKSLFVGIEKKLTEEIIFIKKKLKDLIEKRIKCMKNWLILFISISFRKQKFQKKEQLKYIIIFMKNITVTD